MQFADFVGSGGVTIWHFAPRSTAAASVWATNGIYPGNQFIYQIIKEFCYFGVGLGVILFLAEATRLYLNRAIKREWQTLVVKAMLIVFFASPAGYFTTMQFLPDAVDQMMSHVADDASCNEALYTFLQTAEQGMLATFSGHNAVGAPLDKTSNESLLQGVSYLAFYLAWWIIPSFVSGIIGLFYFVGPIFIPWAIFKPLQGVTAMWGKLMVGFFLGYFMLCCAFFLILSSQLFAAASQTNAVSDPFTTIAFSIVGFLVACSIPSFCVKIMGGTLSLMAWRRPIAGAM